jgi:D-alanyl-D-alanine carboxypeptidase
MKSDATALGLNIWAQSGYRSYSYQKDLYDSYVNRKGKEKADTSSARPGASEHQTGLALDLNTITTSFKDTKEGKWVNDNCYLYGYIIRYPENKTDETGYIFEPWHIRYVGKDLAKKLYNNGSWITLESYFGIESKYEN